MDSKQFCTKKTQEEMDKEMKETTEREMNKLTKKIKENPSLIKKDYSSNSSDSSDSSDSSNSSDSSDSDYESETLRLYKKKIEIKKLEEKKHFTNLELNNLIVENSELKDKLKKLDEEHKKINDMICTMIKIKDIQMIISDIDNIQVYHNYTDLDTATSQFIKLEKLFDSLKLNILTLQDEIKNNFDEKHIVLQNNYKIELTEFENKVIDKYNSKKKILTSYISDQRNNSTYLIVLASILVAYLLFNTFFKS